MPSVKLITLGCDKNRVDGEVLLGLLREAGFTPEPDEAQAEVIVVNTCGFIRDAVQESIETILRLAEYKISGACKALVVTGCMAERYKEKIKAEIPEADAVVGIGDPHATVKAVLAAVMAVMQAGVAIQATVATIPAPLKTAPQPAPEDERLYRQRITDGLRHVAYVKIAEGCDNHCAYCTIPAIRGPYRSRPFEGILTECAALIARGARELTLVAQDTARYGTDLYGEPRLHALLTAIADIDSRVWVRVMYAYPEHITPSLITALAARPNICRYLDMPIQHSHDAVLARMGRHSTEAGLRRVIGALRDNVPGIVLRTTLMVGFPGETDDMFRSLEAFVGEIGFDRLGVFAYSQEAGTPAARMKPQVKATVKQARRDMLMGLQQGIHREKQSRLRGEIITVMLDAPLETDANGVTQYTGRSYRDAYEVDAAVLFTDTGRLSPETTTYHTRCSPMQPGLVAGSARCSPMQPGLVAGSARCSPMQPGDLVSVRVLSSDEYDLHGVSV